MNDDKPTNTSCISSKFIQEIILDKKFVVLVNVIKARNEFFDQEEIISSINEAVKFIRNHEEH